MSPQPHDDDTSPFTDETSPHASTGQPNAPAEQRPERIGPYHILDTLGQGGMGTVYLAQQKEPVRRRVAIKVVKLGMDSVAVLKRFEIERQALAMMNHDAIARVFDGGTTERGQPYFVMEHAPGTPINEYCDRNKLSVEERIKLFQKVCAGVQHAHQKGVIHRDLKPGNVLITEEQGEPKPKIIDFGLARATSHMALQASMYTEMGQVMGTPEYMSPEQADPTNADIDTRTDIYALGVMLYELLVGARPYPGLREKGLLEMQRVIREDEPPRPSTRISSPDNDGTQTAAARRTVPAVLTRALRNDLDWVVLKALEKDRNRRYDSAAGLALDLQRFLDHEPLVAGPPAASYRLKKLLRRYRAQFVAVAVVLLVLVAGVVGTTWFAFDARRNARRADENARLARENEQTANIRATELQQRTDEFNLVSLVVQLDEAQAREPELYPAWPEKIAAMQAWLDGDVARLRDGLPRARTAVRALRQRAVATTDEERESSRRAHPRYPELEALRARLGAMAQTQGVRDGTTKPLVVALAPEMATKTASELNELAWPLVDPDRTVFGREAEGLALAEAGHAKATGAWVHGLGDTLAWALFANGRDNAALAASRAALAAAPSSDRAEYEGYLTRLEAAVDAARGDSGRAIVARIKQEAADLAGDLTTWRFESEADRFLHDTLHQLIHDGEAFLEHDVAGVAQRIAWAKRVEELTITRFADRWRQARTALRVADGMVASTLYQTHPIDLQPQLGLVPIGMNPQTQLWEFCHLRSAWDPDSAIDPAVLAIPTHDADGSIEITADTGIVFVLLPGGTFTMGAQRNDPRAPNFDPQATNPESPVHEVTLAPFFLARHELTQGQWLRLSGGETPSNYKAGGRGITGAHPVEQVDWPMCDEILGRHRLLLPTEAQWEYGCRAGTDTPWWTGAERESLVGDGVAANLADQTAARGGATWATIQDWPELDDGWVVHAPVDTLRPNAFGLYHMHGNVWEWCRDQDGDYQNAWQAGDGLRQVEVDSSANRVLRGGSFSYTAAHARASNRISNAPTIRIDYLGLRPARALH